MEGGPEIVQALSELPHATEKNVMRRGMIEALQPMADSAAAHAPKATGRLSEGIHIGTKLTSHQRSEARETKSYVEVYMGPHPGVKGIANEFGTFKMAPQPYMRPAWDGGKSALLDRMKTFIWAQIKRSAERLARKTARLRAGR
jgi:hypothetical protein